MVDSITQTYTEPETVIKAKPIRIGVWNIALGVLVGNILTGVVGGLVYLALTK